MKNTKTIIVSVCDVIISDNQGSEVFAIITKKKRRLTELHFQLIERQTCKGTESPFWLPLN